MELEILILFFSLSGNSEKKKTQKIEKRIYLCRHGRGGQRLDSGAALGGDDDGRARAEEKGRLHRLSKGREGRRRKKRRRKKKKRDVEEEQKKSSTKKKNTLSAASFLSSSQNLGRSLSFFFHLLFIPFYSTFEIRTPLPSENPITDSSALRTSGSSSPLASSAAASR